MMQSVNEEIGNTVNATILFDIQDYHMDVSDVGALAEDANVQRLALTHLAPRSAKSAPKPQISHQNDTFFRDPVEEFYSGELFVGEDGMKIIIPVP